ncbi:MAG: dihydropteroate synthase [Kordiimonadaceae bacterium]|jgi:dihydropteroate synthase|nr:dihydropteroate synthase [Kordiimonadaceae bacterium]MBT6031120.1 dihydropteroate synthase [Kordiimonadaceae bacterium]
MKQSNYYVQPLGLLRGCSASGEHFECLAGGNIYFSALKIITRTGKGIQQEIVSVEGLRKYLDGLPSDKQDNLSRLIENIKKPRPSLMLNNGLVVNWKKPIIQAVLNITPDSFSDGGLFEDFDVSLSHAQKMIDAGADIIDIGGESTRPGAKPVSIESEKKRVLPIIKSLSGKNAILSIDTRNAEVMQEAVDAGAQIINDVSALSHNPENIEVVRKTHVPVVLMHAQGSPVTMQDSPEYENVILDIYDYLKGRIDFCIDAGISRDKIIVDPGIGFGKTVSHNLQIINNLSIFHGLGVPLLLGVSRKSFIGEISSTEIPEKRIAGSIAAAQVCLDQGAQIIRVHDVEEANQAFSVWNAIGQI